MTAEQEILDLLANDTTDQFKTVRWIHDNLPTTITLQFANTFVDCMLRVIWNVTRK